MKKKILCFVIAICFIVPCMLFISACGNNNTVYAGKDTTLAESLQKVKAGGTIKLDSDITLEEQINIDKKVTIDLNSHTINNTTDIWNDPDTAVSNDEDTWSLISVKENGELTIKNGTLQAKENDCYAIDVRGGKLIIESGTYNGNISAVYVTEGNVTINDGEFNVQQQDPKFEKGKFTINAKDANAGTTANITIKGGKYTNFNPSEFLPEGYSATPSEPAQNGDVLYTVSKN